MLLTAWELDMWMRQGQLKVEPLLEPIQPASIDLRLGNTRLDSPIYERVLEIIDPSRGVYPPVPSTRVFEQCVLERGQFLLVSTLEWIEIGDLLAGILVGKSSLARLGLQVESAGYIDPGYKGCPTLELKNLGPYRIMLRPGMPIAQLRVEELASRARVLYGDPELHSHFQGATGPEMYRIQEDDDAARP
jgi:dCTP deaminase